MGWVGACLCVDGYQAGSSLSREKHPWGFVVEEEMGVMGWGGEGRPLRKACKGQRKGNAW